MNIFGYMQKVGRALIGYNENLLAKTESQVAQDDVLANNYVAALGGIKNIEVIDACITRLRLTLKNRAVIEESNLKNLGAMGVVKLGENNLQVIIGPQAESIANQMKLLK